MKYFLSLCFVILCSSCQQEKRTFFKRTSVIEKKQLSKNLMYGGMRTYQGDPKFQMHMTEALKYDQSQGILHREIGVPYLKRGFAKEFYSYYDEAVAKDALGWQGWRGYLYLYFYRDYERALKDFMEADELTPSIVDYPQNINIDYMKGLCHLEMGNYEKALRFFDEYIEYEKEEIGEKYINARAYVMKGMAYYKAGILDKSKKTFAKGLKMDHENADLNYWYAKLLFESKNKSKAQYHIEEAKKYFLRDARNYRSYVEEFYEIYMEDIEALETRIHDL